MSVTTSSKKVQFQALTGLRFFLALWVVVYHQATQPVGGMLTPVMQTFPTVIQSFLRLGYTPVSVFFVLSGFVLAYSYSLETVFDSGAIWKYAAARFARIYPAYLAALISIATFILPSNLSSMTNLDVAKAGLSFLMLQAWVPETAICWNCPGWSISVEMFFYTIFPSLGVSLWKLSSRKSLLRGAAVLWALSLLLPLWAVLTKQEGLWNLSALQQISLSNQLALFVSFHPLVRLPEFCFGILLARIYFDLSKENSLLVGRGHLFYLPAIGIILGSILFAPGNVPRPLMNSGLLLPVYGMLILGLALGGGWVAGFPGHPIVAYGGSASYSTYILHYPIACYFQLIFLLGLAPIGVFATCVYLVVLVAITCLFHRFFEEPVYRLLKPELIRFGKFAQTSLASR